MYDDTVEVAELLLEPTDPRNPAAWLAELAAEDDTVEVAELAE